MGWGLSDFRFSIAEFRSKQIAFSVQRGAERTEDRRRMTEDELGIFEPQVSQGLGIWHDFLQ